MMALAVCLAMTTASAQPAAGGPRADAAVLVTGSLFLDGAAIGARMVVVGERGFILVSRDAGLTWTRAEVPTRTTLTGVTLYDATRGWAVGHDAIILRTRDGGFTWQTVYAAPREQRPLLDVWFESAERGYAIGAYGYFLETRDGGDTWLSRKISGNDYHLNQIAAAPSGRLYIAAEAGTVYRSEDGGDNWMELEAPYQGSFFGTLPLDDRRVYLYGLRGNLFYSDDAGLSWRSIASRTASLLTNAIRVDGDGALFTGMGGTILIAENAGRSISRFQRRDRLGIAGALDAGDGAFVIYGEFGVERVSTNELEPLP